MSPLRRSNVLQHLSYSKAATASCSALAQAIVTGLESDSGHRRSLDYWLKDAGMLVIGDFALINF